MPVELLGWVGGCLGDTEARYPQAKRITQAALADWYQANSQTVDLTGAQVADLLAFLATLTDPCVEDVVCMEQWIPDPATPSPDGTRLVAKIGTGIEERPDDS